jgi:hypothetical protein
VSGRNIRKILIACGVGISLAFLTLIYLHGIWIFLPTKSTPRELTVTVYRRDYYIKPIIILKHYVDGLHIRDYTLTIDNGVHLENPQSYKLPQIDNGTVEVNIVLGDNSGNFTITYDQAADLHKKGLLIYLNEGNGNTSVVYDETILDRYVYLVSGENKVCYFKGIDSSEWSILMDAPQLNGIKVKELFPAITDFSPIWKKNEWVVDDINSLSS